MKTKLIAIALALSLCLGVTPAWATEVSIPLQFETLLTWVGQVDGVDQADTISYTGAYALAFYLYDLTQGGNGTLLSAPEDWGYITMTVGGKSFSDYGYFIGKGDTLWTWGAYRRTEPGDLTMNLQSTELVAWGADLQGAAATVTANGKTYTGTVDYHIPLGNYVLTFRPEASAADEARTLLHNILYTQPDPASYGRDLAYTVEMRGWQDMISTNNFSTFPASGRMVAQLTAQVTGLSENELLALIPAEQLDEYVAAATCRKIIAYALSKLEVKATETHTSITVAGSTVTENVISSAHTHPGTEEVKTVYSDWAADEIKEAEPLDLIPNNARLWPMPELPTDYRGAITRTEFRRMAMQFVAHRNNCDCSTLEDLVEQFRADKDAAGMMISPFTDGYPGDAEAYYLGVVQGRGGGIFDPEGKITRQEAALMLLRAYRVCVPGAETVTDTPDFTDWNNVDEWAKEAVATVSSWGVMKGMGDGTFGPKSTYSIEQCILTFLRLWNKLEADVDAVQTPLFGYTQCMDCLTSLVEQSNGLKTLSKPVEGAQATFVRVNSGGHMMAQADHYFIYRDGGMKLLDLGVCSYKATQRLSSSCGVTDCTFDDAGNTFTCVVDLNYTMQGEHELGRYRVTIDVNTLAFSAEFLGS